jgi:hypothetical protein
VINNKEIRIAVVTVLQRTHQVDVKARETPLGDRDVQRLGPGMAMNFTLLAVQAGLNKTVSDISRKNKPPGGKSPRVGNLQGEKMSFGIFASPLIERRLCHRPSAERLLSEIQSWGMNC